MQNKNLAIAKEFIRRLYAGRYELISGYGKSTSKCLWRCNKHGIEYTYVWQHAAARNSCGCNLCRKEYGVKKSGKYLKTKRSVVTDFSADKISASTLDKLSIYFEIKAEQVHADRFRYAKYELRGKSKDLYVIADCPDHGVFEVKGTTHLAYKHGGCERCRREDQSSIQYTVSDGKKVCPKCKKEKPISSFRKAGKKTVAGDQCYGVCKSCARKRDEEYRKNLPEEKRKKYADHFRKNSNRYRGLRSSRVIDEINGSKVYRRDKHTCKMCGVKVVDTKKMIPNKATIDHIVPVSKGGVDSYSNVQTLCLSCNSSKNNKLIGQLVMQI